jgi:hypothetical protein
VEQTYGSSGAAPLQRKADGNGAAGPAIADRAVSGHGLQLWAVQRKALRPETESLVASQPEPGPDPGVLAQRAVAGGGQPLDGATRSFFEGRMGHDLGQVRIHTGDGAEPTGSGVRSGTSRS